MSTTLLLGKMLAATLAAAAALVGATLWATPLAAPASAPSVIRTDEFSAPSAERPQPIQYALGPRPGRGLRLVACAGLPETAASCYVARF